MENPCLEIAKIREFKRLEVGDKIVYTKNGNYAYIVDIIDDSRVRTVYMKRKDGCMIDLPEENLQQFLLDFDAILVKKVKMDEDLFRI